MASSRPKSGKPSHMLKVILLGDSEVGKSSLMNVFVNNKFNMQHYDTIGVEFLIKDVIVDRQKYTLQIWDTAGQERFRSLRTPFYRGADCCLLTFSVTDRKSFRNISLWHKEFLFYANINEAEAENFPFIVLGNKIDLEEREVSTTEAQEWCSVHGLLYYETSAKAAVNVDTAFQAVARRIQELECQNNIVRKANTDSIVLQSEKAKNGVNCC